MLNKYYCSIWSFFNVSCAQELIYVTRIKLFIGLALWLLATVVYILWIFSFSLFSKVSKVLWWTDRQGSPLWQSVACLSFIATLIASQWNKITIANFFSREWCYDNQQNDTQLTVIMFNWVLKLSSLKLNSVMLSFALLATIVLIVILLCAVMLGCWVGLCWVSFWCVLSCYVGLCGVLLCWISFYWVLLSCVSIC